MRTRPLCAIALLLVLTASCAVMAPVRGQLVPGPNQAAGRMDDAVVYVESRGPARRRDFPDRGAADSIVLVQGRFEPRVSATVVGSRIFLKNEDQVFHSPFSRSPAAPFRGRPLRSRQSRAIPVRSSGMVRIFCELHARESADVLVLRHGTWTRADEQGRFSLGELRRGKYMVHLWHPTLGDRAMPLDISRRGPVTIDLRY